MAFKIEKAAVLGSGVMGSAIAAHLANAGIASLMLDIVPPEAGEDPAERNRFGSEALKAALKSRPAPFYRKDLAGLIEIGNFEDDFERIAEADWIIEVVKEDLEIKKKVLAQVDKHRRAGSFVSSNTSGISIAAMAEGLSDDFRKHFLGSHFFNPPRYLYLLELIPTADTDPEVLGFLEDFSDHRLGKGVVIASDTPNFVGNRVGVFGMLDGMAAMGEQELTVEEVDFLTGPVIGHPKSASFRTGDLVGLDTFVAVAGNVYHGCPEDESRETFATPPILEKMLEKNLLGDKSGGGFYRKSRDAKGKRVIETLDLDTFEYREKQRAKFPEWEALRNIDDIDERLTAISQSKGRASDFIWRTHSHLFLYCANRIGEIADDPLPIDNAMKWGFGWERGPFEIWDAFGFAETCARIKEEGLQLPAWIDTMQEKGA
ncbi:MAG: 3-hydroxyacyl-CoA dehydrogenase family protein, partial [Candidatus Krumholzibacteria bacterium]|nr:3-hydroxyacyl-CoA dehydrogenase family protein [Candidatus Krumholzibacteria bacterium]